MDCRDFETAVVDLVYGEVDGSLKADLEGHAASCVTCGALASELGDAREVASALPARVNPPRELDERIALAARAAVASSDVRRQPLLGGPLHLAAAGLLMVLVVAGSFALGARSAREKPVPAPVVPEVATDTSWGQWTPLTHQPGVEISNGNPGPEYRDRLFERAYRELTSDRTEDLEDALATFQAIKKTAGHYPAGVEARLGIVHALKLLGRIEDARAEAQAALDDDHLAASESQREEFRRLLEELERVH